MLRRIIQVSLPPFPPPSLPPTRLQVRGEKEVLSEFRALCATALTLLEVSDAAFKVSQGGREGERE